MGHDKLRRPLLGVHALDEISSTLAALGVIITGVPAMSTPVTGTSPGAGTVGPFKPDLGRGINVILNGLTAAGGQAQVKRSFDGTLGNALPITIFGNVVGIYTGDIQDMGSFVESELAAAYYMSLPAAGIIYRISQ